LGKKVNGVRVVPLTLKIVGLFIVLLLVSNFASNYINLTLNRGELVRLMNQLLVKDLKELHTFASNQYEIFTFNKDLDTAISGIEKSGMKSLTGNKSLAMGVKESGEVLFFASKSERVDRFMDQKALEIFKSALEKDEQEGSIEFTLNGQNYFGVFKYNDKWNIFTVRAEETTEFYADSWRIFKNIAFIIVAITIVCAAVGIFLIRYILRFVRVITQNIMEMQGENRLGIIDMKGASNDEITYLGAAFNSTASTINNLMEIFQKFVNNNIVQQAVKEQEIRLEGSSKELTMLFTDIKSFTYMTEALGTDIIKLLNLHYDKAIKHIHRHGGVIGSIIGDALLAVYGLMKAKTTNKSYEALQNAYEIQEVAASLRKEMNRRKEDIVRRRGGLTAEEEKVYKAVLLEVGVGIDGGEVFYGNIGSVERMTNTVIGDNVNSASRLEGLTRIYKVPVICSAFVKKEVEAEYDDFYFLEIDQVMVKGKTEGKAVFWPIPKDNLDVNMKEEIDIFAKALQKYYDGGWKEAYKLFLKCDLPVAEVFKERLKDNTCPEGWNGIWTMKSK
jgi:class 3 adenylate cyclase